MAANVVTLNYLRPGLAVIENKPTTESKPVAVPDKPKVKAEPKNLRGWMAESANAVEHAFALASPAEQSILLPALAAILKAQNEILKGAK